jgi:hypothetical protein
MQKKRKWYDRKGQHIRKRQQKQIGHVKERYAP